jgi:glycosyltransferase involved in cell wall biosynthesis
MNDDILRFSVVTPSFQQGRFIERTICSVLDQKDVAFEYLVVDGGSTDQTTAILERYGDQIRWLSEPDHGQADAVNKGIRLTQGEIIAWINSDDVYYPGALSAVHQVFAAHPEVDVVYGDGDHIDEHDRVLEPYPIEPWDYRRLTQTCFLCQPATFFRRRLVERYGGLDSRLNFCMDYELWLRYGKHARFHYLPRKLAGSRMYADNKTLSQRRAVHRETLAMYKASVGQIPDQWLLGYAELTAGQRGENLTRDQLRAYTNRLLPRQLWTFLRWRQWPAAATRDNLRRHLRRWLALNLKRW